MEADDINRLQDAIVETQGGVNAEEARATSAETELTRNLQAEALRAAGAEKALSDNLVAEVARATGAEQQVANDLQAFIADVMTEAEIDALDGIEPEPPDNQYRPMTADEIDRILNQ